MDKYYQPNIIVVAFVNKFGGASTELDCLARDIHLIAMDNEITLGYQLENRAVVEKEFNGQVDTSSKYVSLLRSCVETSSRRLLHDNSASRVQFDVLESINIRFVCVGVIEQLC